MPAGHELARWLAEVHAEDLYLAFACASGAPRALRAFRGRYDADLDRVLSSRDRRGVDDARQILDQRLFSGPRPKIATYTGRGPLRRWLRVVAGRVLLEIVEDRDLLADEREIAAMQVSNDDPELAYLKAHYRAEYKAAFREALARMAERDRTVLAQYHVDGLTIDQLGALYGIHRSTASRWVTRAEAELRDRVVDRCAASSAHRPPRLTTSRGSCAAASP
jgi:RNA polymerase sigma-70 factor (ECF subfamily)